MSRGDDQSSINLEKLVNEQGTSFLAKDYKYYVILTTKSTQEIRGRREIVEFAAVLLKAEDFTVVKTYSHFVKPSLMRRLPYWTRKSNPPEMTQASRDFSQVLQELLDCMQWCFPEALLIVQYSSEMTCAFFQQCKLEKSLAKAHFPSNGEMTFFDTWCSLSDLYATVLHVGGADDWGRARLLAEYVDVFDRGLAHERCVDTGIAMVERIRIFSIKLRKNLFPTMKVKRAPGDYSSNLESEEFCYTFKDYYRHYDWGMRILESEDSDT